MPTERVQRQIDALLDAVEQATRREPNETIGSGQSAVGQETGSSLSPAGEGRSEDEGRDVLDAGAVPHSPIAGEKPEARALGALRHKELLKA